MCSYLNEALKLCLFLFCGNVFCRKIIKHQISMHMVMTIMTKSLFSLLSLHEIETKDYFGKEISMFEIYLLYYCHNGHQMVAKEKKI